MYRRVTSICGGAYPLAEAGLLDGRRATTHWNYVNDMQLRFPKVKLEMDRIFVQDDPIWTSAGMTAGIDLALALVEADHGAELTRSISRKMVLYHRRSGGQSQFSELLNLEPKTDRIQNVLRHAKVNLRSALSVEELAGVAPPQPAPVQPPVPCRNRAIPGARGRKSARGRSPHPGRGRRTFHRRSSHVHRLRRSRPNAPRVPARLRPAAASAQAFNARKVVGKLLSTCLRHPGEAEGAISPSVPTTTELMLRLRSG